MRGSSGHRAGTVSGRHPGGKRPARGGAGWGLCGRLCSPRAPPPGGRAVQPQREGWGRAAPGAGSLPGRLPGRSPPRETRESRAWPWAWEVERVPRSVGGASRGEKPSPHPRRGHLCGLPSVGGAAPLCGPAAPGPAGGWRSAGRGPELQAVGRGEGALGLQSPTAAPSPSASLSSQDAAQVRPSSRPGWGKGGASPRLPAPGPPGGQLPASDPGPLPGCAPGPPSPGTRERARHQARWRGGPGCARAPSARSWGLGSTSENGQYLAPSDLRIGYSRGSGEAAGLFCICYYRHTSVGPRSSSSGRAKEFKKPPLRLC